MGGAVMTYRPYPNAALTDIATQLLDDYGLTMEQIGNLAMDIAGECEAITEASNEAAWERMNERERDDSAYRLQLVEAGRGHMVKP